MNGLNSHASLPSDEPHNRAWSEIDEREPREARVEREGETRSRVDEIIHKGKTKRAVTHELLPVADGATSAQSLNDKRSHAATTVG